jgi:hypothetical protein
MKTRRILVSLCGAISSAAFWCHIDWWIARKRDVNTFGPLRPYILVVPLDGISSKIESEKLVQTIHLHHRDGFFQRHTFLDLLHLGTDFQRQDAAQQQQGRFALQYAAHLEESQQSSIAILTHLLGVADLCHSLQQYVAKGLRDLVWRTSSSLSDLMGGTITICVRIAELIRA